MKIKKFCHFFGSMVLALSSLMTISLGVVDATPATLYWCSTGATSNFNTATNWNTSSTCSGGTQRVPASGDSLVFDATNIPSANIDNSTTDGNQGDWVINNDITGLSLAGITFQGTNTNYNGYALTGDAITLTGNVTTTGSGINNNLEMPITLGAAITINTDGGFISVGNNITSSTIDLSTYSLSATEGSNGGAIYVNDALSGSGAINISSGANLYLYTAASSYTGAVSVSDGDLALQDANALGSTSGVTVSGTGSIDLRFTGSNTTFNFPLTIGGTGDSSVNLAPLNADSSNQSNSMLTATLSGPVTLTSNITYSGLYNTNITGTLTTNGYSISVAGGSQGGITFPGGSASPPVQTITVNAGDNQPNQIVSVGNKQTYIIDGQRGVVDIENGGVLKGNGQVSNINAQSGGTLAPGHSPGTLTVVSQLNMAGGSTYQAEILNKSPGNFDQMIVGSASDTTGNDVILGDTSTSSYPTLDVSLVSGYSIKAGDVFEIINNLSQTPVSGQFNNMPEGTTFTVGNVVFKITYKGGDGNDVVLTAIKAPGTPNTGSGLTSSYVALPLIGSSLLAGGLYLGTKRNIKLPLKSR